MLVLFFSFVFNDRPKALQVQRGSRLEIQSRFSNQKHWGFSVDETYLEVKMKWRHRDSQDDIVQLLSTCKE